MLTKEQISEVLRQNEVLIEGQAYNIFPANRPTICSQRALDVLIKKLVRVLFKRRKEKEYLPEYRLTIE